MSWNNADKYENTWEDYDADTRISTFLMTTRNNNDENIYTTDILNELLSIHNKILNVTIDYKGNSYQFEDLCDKSYSNNDNCFVSCILEFFSFNQTLMEQVLINTNDYQNINQTNDFNPNQIISYPIEYSPHSQEYETLLTRVGTPATSFSYNYSYETSQGYVSYVYTYIHTFFAYTCLVICHIECMR